MPDLLTLSRAARLAGVSRGELQQKLRDNDTEAFEGKIRISDLLALYPEINLDRDPVFERIQRIKQEARPKSEYSDGWMPDAEVLMTRLKEMNRVLVRTKAGLYGAEQLLRDVVARLEPLVENPATREPAKALRDWLAERLEAPSPPQDARAELFARDALFRVLAPSVKIASSGHEFYVEGRDTILEAALKAGLHLQYGCSSGNCGTCKARVLSGTVRPVREHDYLLSRHERESGHVLACSFTAVTDVVLDAVEARRPAELPHQTVRARVKRIERLAPELALLQLQTPVTQTLRFMAGQSIDLIDEDMRHASYPLASCPCDGRNLQIFVGRRTDRPFTEAVFDGTITGQTVEIHGPTGDFVLQEDSGAPALMFAVNDGFAPIKSLIEHAISIDHAESLHLYVLGWAETVPHVHNLCRAWRDALDNFRFTSLPARTSPHRVAEDVSTDLLDLGACEIYIAGPEQYVGSLSSALLEHDKVSAQRVHTLAT
jgi:CDP-4-dehydro-6-deoxyglucose reductase